jgi:predicted transposase YbfD/YdcC
VKTLTPKKKHLLKEFVYVSEKELADKHVFFKKGIPVDDTIARIISSLSPEELQSCFIKWMAAVEEATDGKIVAVDGKTLRHSYDKKKRKSAIHMVSAYAAENGVVLGQKKTDDKSNEITAIPALLDLLDIKGCIVTIDAMGCQEKIAEKIVSKEADYVLAVKDNQKKLHEERKCSLLSSLQELNTFSSPIRDDTRIISI